MDRRSVGRSDRQGTDVKAAMLTLQGLLDPPAAETDVNVARQRQLQLLHSHCNGPTSFFCLLILAAVVDDDLALDRCAGGVVDVDLAAATTEALAGVIDRFPFWLTQAGGAFAAINAAGSQAGNNILVTIISDVLTEDGTNSLNNGGWTTLTVNPVGARTLAGSVAGPLINLNGASNVTINGLNTGGNSLTISNTDTGATTSTIQFINGASNNTVTNCSVLGSSTGAVAAASGTILISTSTGGANTGNTISNNNIGPAGANLPTKGSRRLDRPVQTTTPSTSLLGTGFKIH